MSASNVDKVHVWPVITNLVTVIPDEELVVIREKMKDNNYYVIDLDGLYRVMVSPDFRPFIFDPTLQCFLPLRVH